MRLLHIFFSVCFLVLWYSKILTKEKKMNVWTNYEIISKIIIRRNEEEKEDYDDNKVVRKKWFKRKILCNFIIRCIVKFMYLNKSLITLFLKIW